MDTLIKKQEMLKSKLSNVQGVRLLSNEKYVILQERMHLCKEKKNLVENILASEQSLCEALLMKNLILNQQKMMAEMTGISEKVKFEAKLELMMEYGRQFAVESEKINITKPSAISQHIEIDNANQIELVNKKVELDQEIASNQEERKQILNLVTEVGTACNILKKRNNAVLILMRKNLQDSELKRRDVMRQLNSHKTSTADYVN